MDPLPLSAHEAAALWGEALWRTEALHELTEALLRQGGQPDLPTLGQMVMQRDNLLSELEALPLSRLSVEQRDVLLEKLRACQEIDAQVGSRMREFQDELRGKLREMKQGQALTKRYALPTEDSLRDHHFREI